MRNLTALVLFALLLAGCGAPPSADYVEVSGEGRVEAVADRFRLRATASARGQDVAEIKREVDRQVDRAAAALKALGLEERHIRALSLQVQPEWQWEPERKLTGYVASRDMEIVIEGIDTYTSALDALTAAGITGIQPAAAEVADATPLARDALARALADARSKAEVLAEQAGRTLGEVLVIVESGTSRPAPMMMESMAKSDRGSFYSPGTSEISASVQVRFALE